MRAHVQAHTDYPMLAAVASNEIRAQSPPAAAAHRQSGALPAEVLAMSRQQGVFDIVHLEATAAATGSLGIQAAHRYPAPEAGLNPSQQADVYAAPAMCMAGARQQ